MITSSTIDSYEVEYYQKMARMWWDTSGPFWPLHRLNKLRIQWIQHTLSEYCYCTNEHKPLNGLSVLDVGCGGGILAESLAKLGARVHAIDVVEKNIHIARAHARNNNLDIQYSHATVESLVDSNEKYDVVFNMEVVEHVADLDTFLNACASVVRPGGCMFVATINRTVIAYLSAIIGAEYILRWLPKGTHRYSMLRKPNEIVSLLASNQIECKEKIGVGVNPFTRKFSLRNNTNINYMLFTQKE